MWQVWYGWLQLLDYTLEQLWWRMDAKDRAKTCITHIQAQDGELVIRGDYPVHCAELLDGMRDASGGLCVCCGRYAMHPGRLLPLCRSCA